MLRVWTSFHAALTNLYNTCPVWFDKAHKSLDAAVGAAYRWADYTHGMPDEEILRRLLALNRERQAVERAKPGSEI